MRIYKINVEHKRLGTNWASINVVAKTADEAIKKAKSTFKVYEILESAELLAEAEI